MKKSQYLILIALIYMFLSCQPQVTIPKDSNIQEHKEFLLGIDNFLLNHLDLVNNKRVGLLTNPSGVNAKLIPTSDLLHHHPRINLTTLYGPEHGIRGAIHAGEHVLDSKDPNTSLPIYSLYGKQRKPSSESLQNVDIILIDIQDIGLRAYTYIYTMAMVMEAAAANNKEVMVLDRPNPIGGESVAGNILDPEFSSFVGLYPLPYRHGMTIGELALLFNSEFGIACSLKVIPMQEWKRSMLWEDTKLQWIPTSPHVPHWQTILFMGATGTFGELGILSEGVGYTSPFELVGAPWIDGDIFASRLNDLKLPGVFFRPLYFRPYYLHYEGEVCQGAQLHISDPQSFEPYTTGLHIMQTHMKLYPENDLFAKAGRVKMFDKVVGTDKIRLALEKGVPVDQLKDIWKTQIDNFLQIRKKYLIYK